VFEAPKQNWPWYEARCREEHERWLCNLTVAESWDLFVGFHRLAGSLSDGSAGLQELENRRWSEKLTLRYRLRDAFVKLDRLQSERRT